MATLAHKDAPVFQHLPGLEEGKVAKKVVDLALPARVGPVDHLDNVAFLDRVLLGVQSNRVPATTDDDGENVTFIRAG